MKFAYFTIFNGLLISAVAAYYSVTGLIAIFPASAFAIAFMGAVLEMGKVVTTVWLHQNWDRCPKLLKGYLTGAVVVLAVITSMGIFGFLSKAHVEQGQDIGDAHAKIQDIDFKIEIEQDTIATNKESIKLIKDALKTYIEFDSATRALAQNRANQKAMKQYNDNIIAANNEIIRLRKEKQPLAQMVRSYEVEVGPIRYIAELFYGNEDAGKMFDSAVRIVIILLIFVFDPLAILLIISGNKTLNFYKKEQEKLQRKAETEKKRKFKKLQTAANSTNNSTNVKKMFEETVKEEIKKKKVPDLDIAPAKSQLNHINISVKEPEEQTEDIEVDMSEFKKPEELKRGIFNKRKKVNIKG